MSKELELVNRLIEGIDNYEKQTGRKNPPAYISRETLVELQQALQRLKAIDNANPSEALECLEEISKEEVLFKSRNTIYMGGEKSNSFTHKDTIGNYFKGIDDIKNALLKAQEPKKYLKWEDLEFKKDGQETLVLLNDTKYRMYYYKGYDECINLFTEDEISVIHIFEGCYPQDKQFFNDLHLERVEE